MYTHIVTGTDGSATSRAAVDHAAALARSTGATLHLVHAFRPPSQAPIIAPELMGIAASADGDAQVAADAVAARVAEELRSSGVDVQVHVVAAAAAEALCSVATTHAADLLVVGNRGMKGARRVLGSVPNSVAHRAPCAVLIVPTC
jgi:nucleotide-binding universal stress UspA family protein